LAFADPIAATSEPTSPTGPVQEALKVVAAAPAGRSAEATKPSAHDVRRRDLTPYEGSARASRVGDDLARAGVADDLVDGDGDAVVVVPGEAQRLDPTRNLLELARPVGRDRLAAPHPAALRFSSSRSAVRA
jgi:hypothetical protein